MRNLLRTVCLPARDFRSTCPLAPGGIATVAAKVPLLLVRGRASVALPAVILTALLTPNPTPVSVTRDPAGPDAGVRLTRAGVAAACVAVARALITITAAMKGVFIGCFIPGPGDGAAFSALGAWA